MKKKVIVGLSGGVDSAVTAYLLKEAGFDVFGLSIQMHENNSVEDINHIANVLNIEYKILDQRELFQEKVKKYFFESYLKGMTPNPCVMCNKFVKFKTLFDFMIEYDADFIATGHYAKIENNKLFMAEDLSKDQSYFLYNLNKEYLPRILFPLGGMLKKDVKELAKKFSISVSEKNESQDICFLNTDYKKSFDHEKGPIVNENGELLAWHNGVFNYTIGQRKGIGISSHVPLFVKDIDAETNTVVVAKKENIATRRIKVFDLNILNDDFLEKSDICDGYPYVVKNLLIKLRYSKGQYKGDIHINRDQNVGLIILEEDAFAVAKGQAAVAYNNDQVVLGGIIAVSP